ncbi:MAG: hypothetical protein RIB60_01750 [Phycisphaerales bacterium]
MTTIADNLTRPARRRVTYARARLWLGISCVGSWVVLSAAALALDVPGLLLEAGPNALAADARAIAVFVAAYIALQLPFDVLGGFALPNRYGREHPTARGFAAAIARGAACHGAMLFGCLLLLHLGGGLAGVAGAVGAVAASMLILLSGRALFARLVGGWSAGSIGGTLGRTTIANRVVGSQDEAFTGGITGVLRPTSNIVPERWHTELTPSQLRLVEQRRALAVTNGSWFRGRLASILFVLAGASIAGLLVGESALGTAGGTIEFSLWYTLWAFLGLLALPTPSRAAVAVVDRSIADAFGDEAARESNAAALTRLDELADGEPARPAGIEAIFHPIPSLSRRVGQSNPGRRAPAWWDVARTSIYLGNAAGGLVGRAVHCNCGRPALWVLFPAP